MCGGWNVHVDQDGNLDLKWYSAARGKAQKGARGAVKCSRAFGRRCCDPAQ